MRFKPLDKLVRRMAECFWYYGASDSWRERIDKAHAHFIILKVLRETS
jgi:hypothetical protein